MTPRSVEILECTLRDGSYAVDFQFTPRDTATIALALERAGVRLIEVGHGLGLGAAARGKGEAASSDEQYLAAVAGALTRAAWGMFHIPGIGRLQDLDLARAHGMHFVRIGTNPPDVDLAAPHIEHARKLGLDVCANLMKSYTLAPRELAAQARRLEAFGAGMVCLVDSAGHMLPEDIREYMGRLTDALSIPVGLHGHDNLALGTANILTAVACGAARVDTTLQGLGRGGGNAATETVVAALERMGVSTGVDLRRIMDVGQGLIRPMLRAGGVDPLHVTGGLAGFHSGFTPLLRAAAERHGVDLRELILAVCERDRVAPAPELVEELAARLAARRPRPGPPDDAPPPGVPGASGFASASGPLGRAVAEKSREIRAQARKAGKTAVLNVVGRLDSGPGARVSHFVQEGFGAVIGSVEVDGLAALDAVVAAADGIVDLLLVDADQKPGAGASLAHRAALRTRNSEVAPYSDLRTWAHSVVRQLGELLGGYQGRTIAVAGLDVLSRRFILAALERGARVRVWGAPPESFAAEAGAFAAWSVNAARPEAAPTAARAAGGADALVGFARGDGAAAIGPEAVEALGAGFVVDAGIGAVSRPALEAAARLGIAVVRPDMRAALAAELDALLGARRIAARSMGRAELAGVPVVAGGLVGRPGEVVVDCVARPTRALGVCDGAGRVVPADAPEDRRRLDAVERELLRRSIMGQ